MASLRVPEEDRAGLITLLNLSSEDTQKVVSTLESVPITNTLRQALVERLSTLDTILQGNANEVVEALTGLYIVLAHSNEQPSEMASEIAAALKEIGIELKFPDEVEQRLTQFLSFDSLVVSAKAEGFMYDYDNVFSTARVHTDIRPIFGLDAQESPKAGVITHTLNIHYFHGGQHKEINIALDEVDIGIIADALERADNKGESLKSVLEMARLTYIEP
jgi:hypothetical protein